MIHDTNILNESKQEWFERNAKLIHENFNSRAYREKRLRTLCFEDFAEDAYLEYINDMRMVQFENYSNLQAEKYLDEWYKKVVD